MTRNLVCLFACLLPLSACNHPSSSDNRQPSSGSCSDPFTCQDSGLTSRPFGGTSSSECPASTAQGFAVTQMPTIPYDDAPAELVRNLETVNAYRAKAGVARVVLDRKLSEFAARGSKELASTGIAHGHFADADSSEFADAGFCGGAAAENQAPGWPAGDLLASIDRALQAMMDEGPGGGHHDNILNPAWGKIGIANIVIGGRLYMTNDFSPKCD